MKMKECKPIKPRLQRFADGELSREDAAQVRSHLMDCLDCRAVAGEVYSVRKFFQREVPIQVPAGFAAKVASLAFSGSSGEREDTTVLPFVRQLVVLAAGLLLMVGTYLVFHSDWERGGGIEVHAGTLGDLDREIEELGKARKEAKRSIKKPPLSTGFEKK